MKSASTIRALTFIIGPGEVVEASIYCDYLRIKSALVEVNILTIDDLFTLSEGEEALLGDTKRVSLSHSSLIQQTIVIIVGTNAKIGSSKVSGNVSVVINNKPTGQFNCTPINVVTTSAQFLAGNSVRKSLMIQNKSLTGNIWVYLSSIAGAATQLNGIKLASGQMLAPDLTHTGFVTIIGDLATNPDVVISEA